MTKKWDREYFEPVKSQERAFFFCAGCNMTPDDYMIDSSKCSICNGRGVLTKEELEEYLSK